MSQQHDHEKPEKLSQGEQRQVDRALEQVSQAEHGLGTQHGYDIALSMVPEVDVLACRKVETRPVLLKEAFVVDRMATCTGTLDIEVISDCGPVYGATVTIFGSNESGCRTLTTNRSGRVSFDDVPENEKFDVKVTAPGYSKIDLWSVKVGDHYTYHQEKIKDGAHRCHCTGGGRSHVVYKAIAQRAKVTGKVYYRRDARSYQVMERVPLTVMRDGRQLACIESGKNGAFVYENVCPGSTIALSAPPEVRSGNTVARLLHQGPVIVQIDPGSHESCAVAFEYVPAPGELRLLATRCEERNGCEHREALHDTLFRVYTDAPAPSYVGEARMTGAAPAIVTHLKGGTYQVTAVPRDKLLRPLGSATARITICDGQIVTVDDFCFASPDPKAVISVHDVHGQPIPKADVSLTDIKRLGEPLRALTDTAGGVVFTVDKDTPYKVHVEPHVDGDSILRASATEPIVAVHGGANVLRQEVNMIQDDLNIVFGRILRADGTPAANITGKLYNSRNQVVATLHTDSHGHVSQQVPDKGWYRAVFTDGQETADVSVEVRSPGPLGDVRMVLREGGGFPGGGGPLGDVPESLVDLSAYPILTEEVGFPSAPASPLGTPGGSAGVSPIGAIAANALREVLGWKARPDDPKGFVGALTQSFELTEFEGHIESKWTPRTYAVQTDLAGGITGAQASIYERARDAIDDAQPLLDGLYALRDDADEQDMAALKAVVRSQMGELVNELGIAGGPRLARVDQIFDLLLGTNPAISEPDLVAGQLGTLRNEMGLWSIAANAPGQRSLVNTVDEEQNVTNYRILTDYLTSLRLSWINSRPFFGRTTTTPFFGTQLVLISRQLSVVAESVSEVRFSMDSVFIGPAERQTIELQFPANATLPPNPRRGTAAPPGPARDLINDARTNSGPLLVEELLTWIYHFAAEEGPRLIQDGGKFAVGNSVLPVVVKLRNLVFGALVAGRPRNNGTTSLPRGYFTLRVQRSLQELATQLDELALLSAPISHTIPSQT